MFDDHHDPFEDDDDDDYLFDDEDEEQMSELRRWVRELNRQLIDREGRGL